MKSFGGNRVALRREPFELTYLDANEEEQLVSFRVLPRVSGGDIAGIMHSMKNDPSSSVQRLIRLLSKVMDNKDGEVPAQWKPVLLTEEDSPRGRPGPPTPEGDPESASVSRPPSYRGPDGEIYPFSDEAQLAEWNDQKLWTSRRRWVYLMEEDDDAVVELEDIQAIAEWVIGLATDRPTQPPA